MPQAPNSMPTGTIGRAPNLGTSVLVALTEVRIMTRTIGRKATPVSTGE